MCDPLYKAQNTNLNDKPVNTDVCIPQPIREKVCEVLLDAIRSNKDIEEIKKQLVKIFGSPSGPKELDVAMGLMAAYQKRGK